MTSFLVLFTTFIFSLTLHALPTPTTPGCVGEDYIVILAAHAPHATHVLSRLNLTADHTSVRHIYNNTAFRGFAASVHPHHLSALHGMADIQHVEKTTAVTSYYTRSEATWGLQRISTSGSLSGDPSSLDYTYNYAASALGAGVDIYLVDTGLDTANIAFGGRARTGFSYETDTSDQDGHGTHVAGTSGANIFGVASGANLIGVKVLGEGGVGSSSDAIAGLNYVVQQHEARKTQQGFLGSVMNLSWGLSGVSSVVDTAVREAIAVGIHVAVAAGNDAGNACSFSPSSSGGTSAAGAVAAGSINLASTRSSFSNTGPCVDVYAPGEDVLSTWIGADNTVNFLSGTSMASPHVAGVMAYLVAGNATLAGSPALLKARIAQMALRGVVTGGEGVVSGDAGLLLNNGMLGVGEGGSAAIPNLFGGGGRMRT